MQDDRRDHDEALAGGNASASVVRIGDTVRKPWLPTTERTVAYMVALRDRGIDLPGPHGRDDQGRLILDFVPGSLALHNAPLDVDVIRTVGRLVRSIHDASTGLAVPKDWGVLLPARDPDLLCHNDLATWNLILDGDRLVSIETVGGHVHRRPRASLARNHRVHRFASTRLAPGGRAQLNALIRRVPHRQRSIVPASLGGFGAREMAIPRGLRSRRGAGDDKAGRDRNYEQADRHHRQHREHGQHHRERPCR